MSAWTVSNLLHEAGFSLQANSKQVEGARHVDRDAQFAYLNAQAADRLAARVPRCDQRGHQEEGAGRAIRGTRVSIVCVREVVVHED